MSETRRDLFKTSILSGLGLMSASALAGCAGTTGTGGSGGHGTCTPTDPDAANYSMAMGINTANNKPNCYVFHYDAGTAAYTAHAEKNYSPGAPPPVPSANHDALIDVKSWFTANSTKFDTAPPSTVKFGTAVTVVIGAGGIVTSTNPPNALSPGRATICSWNEIGT